MAASPAPTVSSAVLGHGDAVLPHLPPPGLSSELGHQLEDLRQTGGADRMSPWR